MVTCQPAMFDDTKGYPFCCSQQQLPQIGRSAWTWSSGRRVMKSDVWTCSLAKICERQRPYVKNSDSSSTNMDLTWFISATVMIWLTTMVISPTKNHGDCSGSFPRNGWVFFKWEHHGTKGGRFRLAVGPQHIWTTSTWPSHGGWTCWTPQHHVHSDSAASWHT